MFQKITFQWIRMPIAWVKSSLRRVAQRQSTVSLLHLRSTYAALCHLTSFFHFIIDFFIARQQARIQIAATIYTQARLRTSLFCFLLYQLSLWWVKHRAQPEAINPWKHAGPNAPWQAETNWGEKVKPRKPAWNQAFLWLSILFHTPHGR